MAATASWQWGGFLKSLLTFLLRLHRGLLGHSCGLAVLAEVSRRQAEFSLGKLGNCDLALVVRRKDREVGRGGGGGPRVGPRGVTLSSMLWLQ